MVNLRWLRHQISRAPEPTTQLTVSRRWLEQVERDLTELELRREKDPS